MGGPRPRSNGAQSVPLRKVVAEGVNEHGVQTETLECGHVIRRKQDLMGPTNARVNDNPKPGPRERLAELLGVGSKNFLGTGLTMQEFMQLHRAEQVAASWALQVPEEKKRRRRAVIQLSQELGRIQETTRFSTRLCELTIEAVIEGDWRSVEEWAEYLTFAKEFPDNVVDGNDQRPRDKYATIFAAFRELLLQVLRADKEMPA